MSTTSPTRTSVLAEETAKRLNFAIISHPDAGKTTITEKLLLFGGAIRSAGAVKSKKNTRTTTSDFMEMEKQRGISVSTSVMGFDYRERKINLLDTPGHADFSEDTYRVLTAVDSALMVIDSVKGVEERTRILFEVCRMRKTPIITFMNKMDREGREPIELLDQVEEELGITINPMTWPIGRGKDFRGVYNLYDNRVILFRHSGRTTSDDVAYLNGLDDPELEREVGSLADTLREDIDLIGEVYPKFDLEQFRAGDSTPVFFGSAINNFGVQALLDCFVDIAPPPLPREAKMEDGEMRTVNPGEEKFTGLIFKIHANLDPKHRDRIAFMRICSGVFERNREYHHVRSGKSYRTSNPTAFMAQDREIIQNAYPGDIVGLHDTGTFRIGDTVTEGENISFTGIPNFAPQIFKRVVNDDPMRSKQLNKGLDQLTEEGVAQLFTMEYSGTKLIGVVGTLQFDVIRHRLEHEYKASCHFEHAEWESACWIEAEDKASMDHFLRYQGDRVARDREGRLVFLTRTRWLLEHTMKDFPKINYFFTSGE
ncbi:MAG: peptide chain release factor 3 [Spirochaetaceae bacterium]